MQIISDGDNLHAMSNLFPDTNNKKKLLNVPKWQALTKVKKLES